MASLSTCHLGHRLGWQILLNLTPFCPKPTVIPDIKGTAVTAADDRHAIRLNASRFKKMFKPIPVFEKRVKFGEVRDTTDTPITTTPTVKCTDRRQPEALSNKTPYPMMSTHRRELPCHPMIHQSDNGHNGNITTLAISTTTF